MEMTEITGWVQSSVSLQATVTILTLQKPGQFYLNYLSSTFQPTFNLIKSITTAHGLTPKPQQIEHSPLLMALTPKPQQIEHKFVTTLNGISW